MKQITAIYTQVDGMSEKIFNNFLGLNNWSATSSPIGFFEPFNQFDTMFEILKSQAIMVLNNPKTFALQEFLYFAMVDKSFMTIRDILNTISDSVNQNQALQTIPADVYIFQLWVTSTDATMLGGDIFMNLNSNQVFQTRVTENFVDLNANLDQNKFLQVNSEQVIQTLTFDVDQVMFTDSKKNVKLTSIDVEVLSNFQNSFSAVIPTDAQIAIILEVESSDYNDAVNATIFNKNGQQIDRTQQITIFDDEDILQILNKNSTFKVIYKFMQRSINQYGLPANDIQMVLSKTPIQASRSLNLLTNTDTIALAAQLNNISYDQLQFVDHLELNLVTSLNNFDPKQLIKAIQTFKGIFLTTNNVESINAKTIFNKFNTFNTYNTFNTWAKIVDVYDVDTVNAVFTHPDNSKVYKYILRLAHIDTPELKSKNPN